jgi:DMSO reductase anchor subunit
MGGSVAVTLTRNIATRASRPTMNPAYSVIIFTTVSGAGYGLLFLIGLLRASDLMEREGWLGGTSVFMALSLVSIGLLASAFHLGRPERAWRAFLQWRSSWLSREGVASTLTYVPAVMLWASWLIPGTPDGFARTVGIIAAIFALISVICTAKIYSTLVTVRQWNNRLVLPAYLALALASGAVLYVVLARLFAYDRPLYGLIAIASLAAALLIKLAYWRSIDHAPPGHTMAEATGLGRDTRVRQWEAPHTAENFVMKEMGYRVGRKHRTRLRSFAMAGFLFGLAALAVAEVLPSVPAAVLSIASLLSVALAVALERWLFFAEAQHVVTLFYGAERA